jgi:hypothetical protein
VTLAPGAKAEADSNWGLSAMALSQDARVTEGCAMVVLLVLLRVI